MIRQSILTNPQAAADYYQAVLLLKDPAQFPWPNQPGLSIYDFLVFWHHRAMMLNTPRGQRLRNAAHSGPVFLPWHRYYLIRLEHFARQALGKDDFRLPYWDWAEDFEQLVTSNPGHDLRHSKIWSNNHLGQFMAGPWEVRLDHNAFGNNPVPLRTPRPLRRFIGQSTLNNIARPRDIADLIQDYSRYDEPNYDEEPTNSFRNLLEGWEGPFNLHNSIHDFIGGQSGGLLGDLNTSMSPNDPTFFLHHCFIDRIWAAWQQKHSITNYEPDQSASNSLAFHRLKDPMHTFFDERITPEDVLDYTGYYEYDSLDFVRTPLIT